MIDNNENGNDTAISPIEAGKILGCSIDTVYSMLRDGRLRRINEKPFLKRQPRTWISKNSVIERLSSNAA